MSRQKRLYRVTWTLPDGTVTHRHFQSRVAAQGRAERLRYGSRPDLSYTKQRVTLPGSAVDITVSDPITWPNDGSP